MRAESTSPLKGLQMQDAALHSIHLHFHQISGGFMGFITI